MRSRNHSEDRLPSIVEGQRQSSSLARTQGGLGWTFRCFHLCRPVQHWDAAGCGAECSALF